MSNYEWDKNCAVVDRLFYWEYFIRSTTFAVFVLGGKDLFLISQNWYVDRAKRRLPIYLASWLVVNAISGWFCVYPLTRQEIKQQWLKRKVIGKFNYSLSFLDLEEDYKEWAKVLQSRQQEKI